MVEEKEMVNLRLVESGMPKNKEMVESIVISNASENEEASKTVAGLRALWTRVEAERKKVSKPLDDAKKALQSQYKPILDEIEDLAKKVKGKMNEWILKEEKRIQEERIIAEQKNKEILEKAENGEVIDADMIVAAPSGISKASNQTIRKIKKFRIVDKGQIPIDYLIVDEKLIRKEMNKGVVIPGVEYYEENSIAIKS